MNSRIYSKEVFDREIERLKIGYYYCPECFQNSLTDRIEQLQLFGNYCCKNCGLLLSKNEALTKEKVREIKINKILK